MSRLPKKGDDVQVKVVFQGKPVVETAYVHTATEDVALIYVSIEQKRMAIIGTGCGGDYPPSVYIEDPEDTDSPATAVEFPDYPGWHVFAATISKYTMAMALAKDD